MLCCSIVTFLLRYFDIRIYFFISLQNHALFCFAQNAQNQRKTVHFAHFRRAMHIPGCKVFECFVLAQRGMRPAAGNDTGSSGERFLSREKEIEQARGFPGLKNHPTCLRLSALFFDIHISLQNLLEFK